MKMYLINIILIFTLMVIFSKGHSQGWPRIFGDNILAYGQEITEVYDKGYFIRGSILKDGSHFKFGWLIKTDINGDILWDKKFGDPAVENFFLDFDKTPDNGLVISGGTAQEDIMRDPLFIKLDLCGDIEWCKIFLSPHDNTAPGVISLPDGTFIGMLQYYGGNAQEIRISLVKMDASGEPNPLMGDTIIRGGATALLLMNDTIMYSGLTWTDDPTYNEGYCDVLKTDTNGLLKNKRQLLYDNRPPTDIIRSFDDKVLVIGTYYIDVNWDIYLWKMTQDLEDDTIYTQPMTYDSLCPYQITSDTVDLDCGLYVNIDEIPTKQEYESTIKISPNPARDWIALTFPDITAPGNIELVLYNVFGQEVLNKASVPTNRMASLNISSLSSGIYFLRSKDNRNRIMTGKFVVGR